MEKIEYSDEGQFCSGHVACAGCVEALSMRVILNALGKDTSWCGRAVLFRRHPGRTSDECCKDTGNPRHA